MRCKAGSAFALPILATAPQKSIFLSSDNFDGAGAKSNGHKKNQESC
jgi:hypothetical protein